MSHHWPHDSRLQRRYLQLVQEHMAPADQLAAGLRAVPGTAQAFASTQAAWRFYANPRVTRPQLAQLLIAAARDGVARDKQRYALVVHDWSQPHFNVHASKLDRTALSHSNDLGSELLTALVLSDRDGAPIATVCQQLRAAQGVYSSRSARMRPAPSQLDALPPTMRFLARLKLGRPVGHTVDREADSVAHFRQWDRQKRLFLVRADNQQVVQHEGQRCTLPEVVALLHQRGAFSHSRTVWYHGQSAEQFVAATEVTLDRPARPQRAKGGGKRRSVRGRPLSTRLAVSEVRGPKGELLATWLLLTNVPTTVSVSEVALWYYWRWHVETYFKLLKGAGLHLEQWQQETALAVAKRLLVASMACVVARGLARSEAPEAADVRQLLVRLGGRQMKRGCEFTEPALLSGLWVQLSAVWLLEHHDPRDLIRMAQTVLPIRDPPEKPRKLLCR